MAGAFLPICAWALWQTDKKLTVPWVSVLAWGLAAIALAQAAIGKIFFAGDGAMAALFLSGFAIVALAGSCFACSEAATPSVRPSFSGMWSAIVLACIVSMGIALHQWLDVQLLGLFIIDLPAQGRIFANLAQPNHFATLLLLGITGCLYLYEVRHASAAVALSAALFFAFGLAMTGSRSVLLAVCWFWLIYAVMRKRCALRLSLGSAIAVTAFYLVCVFAWQSLNELLLVATDAKNTVDRLADGSVRTIYWRSMVDAIAAAPWWGYGWGQIQLAQQTVALAHAPTFNSFDSSHNLALDLMLWNGIPAGLTATLLITAWFVQQIRNIRQPLAWCLLLGVGCVFTHALVEYPLSYAYFLLPVGFWMGALSATPGVWLGTWAVSSYAVPARTAVAVIASGTFVFFAWASVDYPSLEADWARMRFEEQGYGKGGAQTDDGPMLLSQVSKLIGASRIEVKPGMSAKQLEQLKHVAQRYGYSSVLYRHALAQGLNNNRDGAVRTLQLLCSMHERRSCLEARKDWSALSQSQWPQLRQIPFPLPASTTG